jgi:hypothetical protein
MRRRRSGSTDRRDDKTGISTARYECAEKHLAAAHWQRTISSHRYHLEAMMGASFLEQHSLQFYEASEVPGKISS